MNTLQIFAKHYEYEIDGAQQPPVQLSDFIVDGLSLSEKFSLNAWFGSTCFDDMPNLVEQGVQELLGLSEPTNQFDSGRFVLYRCHCGCDYCGVISCVLERHENSISWSDIRFEDDEPLGSNEEYLGVIELVEFDLRDYESVIRSYLDESENRTN